MAKKTNLKCDLCSLPKNPIVYIRSSRKLCTSCWKKETDTNRKLIEKLPWAVDWPPPLGYQFVGQRWFKNERLGSLYADHIFLNMISAAS